MARWTSLEADDACYFEGLVIRSSGNSKRSLDTESGFTACEIMADYIRNDQSTWYRPLGRSAANESKQVCVYDIRVCCAHPVRISLVCLECRVLQQLRRQRP